MTESRWKFFWDVVLRTSLLTGSVAMLIQGHDWESEVVSLMGVAGLFVYVCLTTPPGEEEP